jgi:2-amino-4-hydroxy-6-hydroxymethyldihydropteridine diphosphokinase
MARVFIGLGSNLANPLLQVQSALRSLSELPSTQLQQVSPCYASTPQGPQDQPDFVNAVCLLQTELTPLALLDALQAIEQAQGRIKKRHWGERLIDLDILLYDNMLLQTECLTLPHPQMVQRDFVLIPLADIAPGQLIVAESMAQSVEQWIAGLATSYLKPLR